MFDSAITEVSGCLQQGSFRRGTRGNTAPTVEKLPERIGTAFPLIVIMDGTANHFPAKNALDCRISHTYNRKIFVGLISPDSRKSAFGAWTQTPISVSLASVPIFLVLRNDHRSLNQPAVAVDVAMVDADEERSVILSKQRRVVVVEFAVVEILQRRRCPDRRQAHSKDDCRSEKFCFRRWPHRCCDNEATSQQRSRQTERRRWRGRSWKMDDDDGDDEDEKVRNTNGKGIRRGQEKLTEDWNEDRMVVTGKWWMMMMMAQVYRKTVMQKKDHQQEG